MSSAPFVETMNVIPTIDENDDYFVDFLSSNLDELDAPTLGKELNESSFEKDPTTTSSLAPTSSNTAVTLTPLPPPRNFPPSVVTQNTADAVIVTPRPETDLSDSPSPRSAGGSPSTTAEASSTKQPENTGRWSTKEHSLFLEGLKEHGKAWKKIALMIKTRSVVQVRTHAQKYFQKLNKSPPKQDQNGDKKSLTAKRQAVSSVARTKRNLTSWVDNVGAPQPPLPQHKRRKVPLPPPSAQVHLKKQSISPFGVLSSATTKWQSTRKDIPVETPQTVLPDHLDADLTEMFDDTLIHLLDDDSPGCHEVQPSTHYVPVDFDSTTEDGSIPDATSSHGSVVNNSGDASFRVASPVPNEPQLNIMSRKVTPLHQAEVISTDLFHSADVDPLDWLVGEGMDNLCHDQ